VKLPKPDAETLAAMEEAKHTNFDATKEFYKEFARKV